MYNPQSLRAEEFINHAEILDTLEYARAHKNDTSLLSEILAKAARRKGLNHREAAVLLLCEDDAVTEQMNRLARQIKLDFYGSRIVIFAPLYLSNYCVNGCTYCPYHAKNKHISRKKLSQEDIVREVTALQDMGHKRLAIEAGEDPLHNPISYILECIDTIYHIHHKNGAISFRKPITRKAMKSFTPPVQSTITTTTPKPWTVLWLAALMMWDWACCSGWKIILTSW